MYINQKIVVASKNALKIMTSLLLAFIMCASVPLLCSSDDEREAWNAVMGSLLIDGGLGFDMMGQHSIDANFGFVSGEDSEKGVHSDVRELSYEPAEQFSRKRKRVEGDERRAKRVPAPDQSTAAHVLSLPDLPGDLAPLQPFLLSDQDLDLESLPYQDLDSVPLSHAFVYSMLARSDSALRETPQHSDSVLRQTPPPFNSDPELDPELLELFLSCRANGGGDQLLDELSDKMPHNCCIDGCTRTFSHPRFLLMHQRSVHFTLGNDGQLVAKKVRNAQKPFECTVQGCVYASAQSGLLKIHMRTHTGEKSFKCGHDGCDYTTIHSQNLKRHIRIHTGEKPFECVYEGCGYATAQKGDLETHIRNKHTGEKPFKCGHDGCGYAAAHSQNLKRHIRIHTGEKPFECVYEGCGYATAQKDDLETHIRNKHTGEKPFECGHDGRDYASAQKVNLETHIKSKHTGEKLFKCGHDGCDYTTAQSQNLKAHMRTHTGEKPFKCWHDGCDYTTAQSQNLKRHMRMHTGEKPFKCGHDGCVYATAQKRDLTKHKKAKHPGLY